ncbi:MAG: hypothetical protein GY801_47265 [bacterium]|nr:hypothetical protein [bacterium]
MGTRRKSNAEFVGMWHIYKMKGWDEDYFNMDVQAYVDVEPRNLGSFQFGLVSGQIDGKVITYPGKERFEFTWDGNDEGEPANGFGWIEFKDSETIEGEFRIHFGDDSKFWAKKAD